MGVLLMLAAVQGVPTRDPGAAVWWSLLPGGGQFYTHQVAKGLLLGAGETYFLVQTLSRAWEAYDALQRFHRSGDPADRAVFLARQQDALFAFFWYLTFWAYATADAYISAHLYRVDLRLKVLRKELGVGVRITP